MDLYEELNKKTAQLEMSVKLLRKSGIDYATAYTDYRVALAKELLLLKAEGYAISLANDIARGKAEIAHLKFKEISSEAIYKANQESINALKLQLKLIEAQLNREWSVKN